MRRMRDIYGADREVGDMTLGSITQFVHRKLSSMLDEIAPQEEAPVVRQCLDEFMDQPSCVFQVCASFGFRLWGPEHTCSACFHSAGWGRCV